MSTTTYPAVLEQAIAHIALKEMEAKAKKFYSSRLVNRVMVTAGSLYQSLEVIDNDIQRGVVTFEQGEMQMASVLDLLVELSADLDLILKWEKLDKENRTLVDRIKFPFGRTRRKVSSILEGFTSRRAAQRRSRLIPFTLESHRIMPSGGTPAAGMVVPTTTRLPTGGPTLPRIIISPSTQESSVWGDSDSQLAESASLSPDGNIAIAHSHRLQQHSASSLQQITISRKPQGGQ